MAVRLQGGGGLLCVGVGDGLLRRLVGEEPSRSELSGIVLAEAADCASIAHMVSGIERVMSGCTWFRRKASAEGAGGLTVRLFGCLLAVGAAGVAAVGSEFVARRA